jgi:HTH-type transcriptional regulator / antitoxin HigA
MDTNHDFHSDLPIPPGEYLEEVLEELRMSKAELARRMGRPATKISAIFKGEKAITPETAMQLQKVVGVPANIWLGLESEYRLALARQAEEEQIAEEIKLLTPFRYSELADQGVVRKSTSRREKVRELQRFFGVASLSSVSSDGALRYQPAFRVGKGGTAAVKPYAVASWLRMGEIFADGIDCEPFDPEKLEEALAEIRAMTLQHPREFQQALRDRLAACGVALIIVPHFSGTKAHGATFWLSEEKAVLMLSIRGRWADVFWFSLFHELGHILLHSRRDVFIEKDKELPPPEYEKQEEEADVFARETLIPPPDYRRFVESGNFYPRTVETFAREIGIDSGIVVGRLQHDGHLLPQWGNKLRTKYDWAEQETEE